MAILLTDNFNVDLSKWQIVSGTWTIESGELSGTAGSASQDYILSVNGSTWTDYDFTADVWVKSSTWDAGLAFRVQDVNNHYLLAVRSNSTTATNVIDLYKRVAGNYTALAGVSKANLSIPDNTRVTILIRVIGTSITVYANGKKVLTYTDSTFSVGRIGCRVNNLTHAHFDNISVVLGNESVILSNTYVKYRNDLSSSITISHYNDVPSNLTINAWNAVTAYYTVIPVYRLGLPASISVAKTNDVPSNFTVNAWNSVTALYEAVQPPVKHIHVLCIADALLREAKPTQNFGNSVNLGAGYSLIDLARLRTLMKFDVASVPAGLNMVGAYLKVYSQGKLNPPILQVYQVLTEWTEYGVTWNGQPGTRYVPEIEVQGVEQAGWIEFDITQLFYRWYNGLSNNYGVLVRLKDEALEQIPFYSREYPNELQKPEILFLYKIEATPARVSISCNITVKAGTRTQIQGSIVARLTRTKDITGRITVNRLDTIPCTVKVRRNDTLDCSIKVYKPSVLPCDITVKRHDALFGSITVSINLVSDFASSITVHRPDTLPCNITVNRYDTLPCSVTVVANRLITLWSTITVRHTVNLDLSGSVSSRRAGTISINSSLNIKTQQNEDFNSSVMISKKEISASVTPRFSGKADVQSTITARVYGRSEIGSTISPSRKDMPSTITTRAISQILGTVSSRQTWRTSIPSKVMVNRDVIGGTVTVLPASNMPCSIQVISGWLACKITVIATTHIPSQVTARQRDVSEIVSEIIVGRGGMNTSGMVMYIPGTGIVP